MIPSWTCYLEDILRSFLHFSGKSLWRRVDLETNSTFTTYRLGGIEQIIVSLSLDCVSQILGENIHTLCSFVIRIRDCLGEVPDVLYPHYVVLSSRHLPCGPESLESRLCTWPTGLCRAQCRARQGEILCLLNEKIGFSAMLCKLGPRWAYLPLLQEIFDRGMERTLDLDTGSRCRWYGMDPAQELLTPCGPSQHCYLKCKSSCLPCWVPRWFREFVAVELLCKLWNALLCSVAVCQQWFAEGREAVDIHHLALAWRRFRWCSAQACELLGLYMLGT